MKAEDLKLVVKEKYGAIASQSENSCCGSSCCCGDSNYSVFNDDYSAQKGYNPDADLNLGCGIPTKFAGIKEGDSVLDLGSGAGNDCFVARSIVGESGKVTGLDFTDEMLLKAKENKRKSGFTNIEFVKGDIEDIPLPTGSYDVVVSNCVLNLVPDKLKAFSEIMRVLKSGGHFCVSDVVLKGNLPSGLKESAAMYAGCVSGALEISEYLEIIDKTGFGNVVVHTQKVIEIPHEILSQYLNTDELAEFKQGETGIFSITVTGYKKL